MDLIQSAIQIVTEMMSNPEIALDQWDWIYIVGSFVVLVVIICFLIHNHRSEHTHESHQIPRTDHSHDSPHIPWTVDIERPEERAGRQGEEYASKLIKQILRDGDHYLSNIEVSYDGSKTELDNVIINRYGVFIIEVKNYKGYLLGNEDDYEWRKFKQTDAGNVYEKAVRNPIKQVKRQVYILANFLRYYGVNVWVTGYVYLNQRNSPTESTYILEDLDDIDQAIHTRSKANLSQAEIDNICRLL